MKKRRRSLEERLGASIRHGRPGDLAGRGEPLSRASSGVSIGGSSTLAGSDDDQLVEIHTLNLRADAQEVADGGSIEWQTVLPPPTPRVGFSELAVPITQIKVEREGVLHVDVHYLFDTFETNEAPQIVLIRDGVETVYQDLPGPLSTNWWVD